MLAPGTRLGPYEIIGLLGQGGMGQVYRGRDVRLERTVAVKVLAAQSSRDPDARRRFEVEARAASALNHPNIVTLHDVGSADGVDYIVTELVAGGTLRALLAEGPLPEARVRAIAGDLAAGLAAAHAIGIVHRDLKPENVMITPTGLLKILDFGLAKMAPPPFAGMDDPHGKTEPISPPPAGGAITAKGVVIGTVAYMSPEQARGDPVDARSDQFAFGTILYELLAGSAPFERANVVLTLTAILTEEPAPLPDPGSPLAALVARCLAKEPERRFPGMAAIASSLADISASSSAPRVSPPPSLLAASGGRIEAALPIVPPAPRRRPRLPLATAAVALLALLGLAGLLVRRGGGGTPRTLAVLPFGNATGDAALDYLGEGVPQEILQRLGASPALRVMAWSTVVRRADGGADPRELGRALDVDALLEGRFAARATRTVLEAELVAVGDGAQLWGRTFDVAPDQPASLAADVARELAAALQVDLGTAAREPASPEARECYLKGRHLWNRRTAASLEAALLQFRRALELDPQYARAQAGLADTWSLLGYYGFRDPALAYPEAKAAALAALVLDPALAEAHVSLGEIRMYWDRDFAEAEREMREAIRLDDDYPTAHAWYATALAALGRADEAAREAERARTLDPLSQPIAATGVAVAYLGRRFDEAVARGRAAVAMDPDFPNHRLWLGRALLARGQAAAAVVELEEAARLAPGSADVAADLAAARAGVGRRDEAAAALAPGEPSGPDAYRRALVEAALGEREAALADLARAIEARAHQVVFAGVDPRLDSLRDDPRFAAALDKVGLPKR